MKYVVEIGSGAMIYIPSFHKDWFSHSTVDKGEYADTHIILFKIRKVG
jgi:hypothetical protein